ncbi:MAG: hypothetical protein KDD27_06235 [Saprospiraceae bacterium]|nr:hypothetical protein [Saprospiraceae bacterium]
MEQFRPGQVLTRLTRQVDNGFGKNALPLFSEEFFQEHSNEFLNKKMRIQAVAGAFLTTEPLIGFLKLL